MTILSIIWRERDEKLKVKKFNQDIKYTENNPNNLHLMIILARGILCIVHCELWSENLLFLAGMDTVFKVHTVKLHCFGSGSDFFSWVRIQIGQKSGSVQEKSRSGSIKKMPKKLKVQVKQMFISNLALSTISILVRFLQNLIKRISIRSH